jgi:hypothetical protein
MIRAYVHIPAGNHRVIACGYRSCRQLPLDLLQQRPQFSRYPRVLIKQIGKAILPSLLLVGAGRFKFPADGCGELLARFRQPPLGCLCFPRIATPEQTGELAPRGLPHVRDRRYRHCLPGPLSQCYQNISRHLLPPYFRDSMLTLSAAAHPPSITSVALGADMRRTSR